MRKICSLLLAICLLSVEASGQVVSVTNPTNTTPNLTATYTSLASAITALNTITAISGPVTITLNTGNPEMAPAGGYAIQFTATTTAANTITISGSNNTITASNALVSGRLYDAIFKIIGADYITIQNFIMQENPANTTTASGTNNMTEWGVALLHSSTSDGAQNNTIQNNTINLDKTYTNTFGIYSNARHSATAIATTQDIINNTTAPNSGNKVYGNTISNVNMGITFIGSGTAANQDVGNDIGGNSISTGNTITNWGGAVATSGYISNSGTSYCIFSNHQTGENVSYNTISSATVSGTAVTFVGIRKDYSTGAPTGTFSSTISNNTITMTSAFTSGTFDGILSQNMGTLSTATININNNTLLNCAITGVASSSTFIGLVNSSAPGVLNMSGNIIKGTTSTATTGGFTGIQNTGAVVTTLNMNNNQLGNGGSSPIIFSVTTSGSITGLSNSSGTAAENASISNNSIDGISCPQSGTITAITITGGPGANFTVNNNNFVNTSVTGIGATGSAIIGINNNSAAATLAITNNTINNHTSTSTGSFVGIQNTGAVISTIDISSNQIGSATANAVTLSAAITSNIYGIQNTNANAAATVGITFNTILGINGVSNSSNTYTILNSGSPATTNITNNTIGNASRNAITFSAASTGAVFGIINTGGAAATNLNITNNTVDKISGVSFTNGNPGVGGIVNTSSAIGGTLNLNNNAIGTTTGTFITTTASSSANMYAMLNTAGASTAIINMNNNTIDGFFINSTTGNLTTMALNGSNVATALMSGNSFGSSGTLINYAAAQPSNGTFRVMDLGTGSSNATSTMICQNNTVRNIIYSVTGTSTFSGIFTNSTPLTQTISGNQFINLNLNISGSAWVILDIATRASGQTLAIDNNTVVTGLTKTVSGGVVSGYYSFIGASANGSMLNITNNNFSNMSGTGSTQVFGIVANSGASVSNGTTATITGNTVTNLTAVSNDIIGIYVDRTAAATISNNTLSNYASNAAIYGIDLESLNGQGAININNNTVSNFSSTGASGHVRGLLVNSPSLPTINIYSNNFTTYSTAGSSNFTAGVMFNGCQTANVYDNAMNSYTNASTSAPLAAGVNITAGTTFNIYRNNIHTLSATGIFSPASAVVSGIRAVAGTTCNVYNNFISDLTAPTINYTDAIRGIDINSAVASSTYNLYYNSVYVNASSTGTDFGTSGIYHTTNATATTGALNMVDNIIVNTSTANGAGVTAAYRRSDATLTNFTTTSDHNLFYAGTPGATKLIYYDGTNSDPTLAAYQTRVNPIDANSISLLPTFTSSTDLHLLTTDCSFNNKGIPVAGITTDIDVATRNASTPDIGADEVTGFAAVSNAALATSSTNGIDLVRGCDDGVWTYYTDPADASRFLFAIQWDPLAIGDNTAAKATATARLQVDATDFSVTNTSIPEGTWTMKRYWNVDLHGTSLTNPVNVRFFYSATEKAATDAAAAAFIVANPTGTPEPPMWFKTKTTSFVADAAHMNEDRVYDALGLVDVNAGPATTLNSVLYAEFDAVTSFSGGTYATGVGPNTPLPVTFNYLRGIKQSGTHLLSWKVTCNSTPKVTLVLERSADARIFNDVYSITADAIRCQQEFIHTDANPLNGINYYRLRIIDADGKITYSNIISLLNAVKGFEVINIAPNPVTTGSFKLNVTSAAAGKMDVVIIDMQGRVVGKQTVTLIAGYNSLDMNVANLAAGTYNIYGTTAQDKSKVIRFVKQ